MPNELISLLGRSDLEAAIAGWSKDTEDLTIPFTQAGREVLQPYFAKRFAAGGPGWAPLSPAYAARKAARYGHRPVLTASGRMAQAFSGDSMYHVRPSSLSVDGPEDVSYWRYHQTGTSRMPQRQIIPSDLSELAPAIGSRIGTYLLGKAKSRGFRVTE